MLSSTIDLRAPTPSQWSIVLLLFSLALSWSVFSALGQNEVNYARVVRLIWVSLLFASVAMARFIAQSGRVPLDAWWRLAWTTSFALYLVHFLYGVFIVHEGSFRSIYAHQGVVIATSNFLLTILWSNDVLQTWMHPTAKRSQYRFWINVAMLLAFLIATLIFGSATAKTLGAVLLATVIGAYIYRINWS